MPAASIEDVVVRASTANDQKQNWVSQYRDAYEFGLPMRNLYETFQPGADKMSRVFDSTAINSTQKFASRLQSNLTPPFQEWLDFLPGTDVGEEQIAEATAKLQIVQKKFFSVIQNSNFDTSSVEGYLDLAVGTMAMLVLEGPVVGRVAHVVAIAAQALGYVVGFGVVPVIVGAVVLDLGLGVVVTRAAASGFCGRGAGKE